MAKSVYRCSECNKEFPKWSGWCEDCGAVATIEEVQESDIRTSSNTGRSLSNTIGGKRSDRASIAASGAVAAPVSEIVKKKETTQRLPTGINEFDRVLGGGLVPGGVIILAGPPGVGKALDINTPILTPEGFKPLEELHVGDKVYSSDGSSTFITAETEIFKNRPTYYFVAENGETVIADENHEWLVLSNLRKKSEKLNSKEIYERVQAGEFFSIRCSDPVEPTADNINPISVKLNKNHPIYHSQPDLFTVEEVIRYSVEDRTRILYSYLLDQELFVFINDEERYFGTLNPSAAEGLMSLAHSIGIKTEISQTFSEDKADIIVYPRHKYLSALTDEDFLPYEHPNHYILIDEILEGPPTDTKCIEVAHESHMFLAGKTLIPTHNSSVGLAVAAQLASVQNKKVLYITGEETDTQVAQRALRTGAAQKGTTLGENLLLLAEQNLQNCLRQAEDLNPDFILVDSLQALLSENSESSLGSIAQVTEVATAFTHLAKHTNTPTILIGQVTKDNEIAGPRVVEHLVDTVLFFESNSETPLRFLRALKNRYGSTDEIGCFEHTERGLEEVEDPSGFFVNEHEDEATGYASTVILEGMRPLPLEINALTLVSNLGNPRRVNTGIEQPRSLTIQAVLSKYVGLNLDSYDVYVATAGGLRIKDTATDLAVAAALMSSYRDLAIPHDYAFIGEVSLTGEIRPPRDLRRRILELERLGFKKVFCPTVEERTASAVSNVEIVEVKTLQSFVRALFQ